MRLDASRSSHRALGVVALRVLEAGGAAAILPGARSERGCAGKSRAGWPHVLDVRRADSPRPRSGSGETHGTGRKWSGWIQHVLHQRYDAHPDHAFLLRHLRAPRWTRATGLAVGEE